MEEGRQQWGRKEKRVRGREEGTQMGRGSKRVSEEGKESKKEGGRLRWMAKEIDKYREEKYLFSADRTIHETFL